MFLTTSEIVIATGCTQPAAQEHWFNDRWLPVHRNRVNKVIVAREDYVRWQLGEKHGKAQREPSLRLRTAA